MNDAVFFVQLVLCILGGQIIGSLSFLCYEKYKSERKK